jgi:serine/threonine protein kinase
MGDGYRGGSACRKESRSCNPSRFLSGRCGGTTGVGVLIGGISVGASLILGITLISCFIRKRTISSTERKTKRQLTKLIGDRITIYPYSKMEKATNKFAVKQRLGTGAYGTVYSGKLHDDKWVAIKRIKHRVDTDNGNQVMNEIKLISSVNHPNIVRLLGCSIEKGEQILVYEYMPNGTLLQHLQKERGNGLAWPIRVTIACEIAQAIAYLHSTLNPPIYHRDIKSSNILLDYNYKTKIADFGLSRLGKPEWSHVSTTPQGTPGYLDPQYHQNFHLSDKSDVYSFGVVLSEIITGLKAVDCTRPPNEVILASLVLDRIGRGGVDAIIDPFFGRNMDKWTVSSVHRIAELIFRCLAFQSDARPSMIEVASELEQIRSSKWTLFTCDIVSNVDERSTQLPDLIVEERKMYRNSNSMESTNDSSHSLFD